MQMHKSEWLTHWTLLAISVQWLEVILEMVTIFRFSKVLVENFDAHG